MKNLKIVLISILAFCVLVACAPNNNGETNTPDSSVGKYEYDGGGWSSMEYKVEEKVIDSCEYIIIFGSDGRDIIHKANCNNPFHTSH